VAALKDCHPPTDLKPFPRKNLNHQTPAENLLGRPWSSKISTRDDSIKRPLARKTACLKDRIALAGVPQVMGTEIIKPWVPEADATTATWALEAGAEIVGTA
jgi:amidase